MAHVISDECVSCGTCEKLTKHQCKKLVPARE